MGDLQQGIEYVGQAIQFDTTGSFSEAISYYGAALSCFEKAFHGEKIFYYSISIQIIILKIILNIYNNS